MQKTTAQSQKESQKTRATCVVLKTIIQKKNMRAFNVACPRQRNIYQITSPTTCILHAYRQASKLRLNSFFHLDYFTFIRTANSPRLLYLAAIYMVTIFSCYPSGTIFLQTKAICSKRTRRLHKCWLYIRLTIYISYQLYTNVKCFSLW